MMQLNCPGVYIREVPSGAPTITGVATSITAFVGRAARGPVNTPTAILSYLDYARIFSEDTSLGEMTDQVRQFFLNGGQQAYVVRIAGDVGRTNLDFMSGPTKLFTLAARTPGVDGAELRAAVDYNTSDPENTFNLTIYRETIDANGEGTASESETFANLSVDSLNPRYVVNVVNSDSQLATASAGDTLVPAICSSVGGLYASSAEELLARIKTAVEHKGGHGSFSLLAKHKTVKVTVQASDCDTLDGFANAVRANAVLNLADLAITITQVGAAGPYLLRFTAGTAGDGEVRLGSADTNDIAAELLFGTELGGVEFGPYSALRPLANGLVSNESATSTNNLSLALNLGATVASAWVDDTKTLALNVGPKPLSVSAKEVNFNKPATSPLCHPSTEPVAGIGSLREVRHALEAIASAINAKGHDWTAEVQGLRLVLLPQFGNAQTGPIYTVTSSLPGPAGLFPGNPRAAAGVFTAAAGVDLVGKEPTQSNYTDAFAALDSQVDLFNILVLPRSTSLLAPTDIRKDVWGAASAFCQSRRAFLVIDLDRSYNTIDAAYQGIKDLRVGLVKDYAAAYWPRLEIKPDGIRRRIDPSGSIAGVMSRIDSNRGVWKAPAGLEADIRGALGLEVPMSDPQNGRLNPEALNCLRAFAGGLVSWGARTVDGYDNSANADFKYVPVRRFTLFLEESLYRGLKWAVFEPNDERLWSQIRMVTSSFLQGLYRQGAFAGTSSKEAFFVKVDSETTTPNDVNLGIVNVLVGFAPLKPAEFIVVTIQQKAGQVQV